MEKVEVRFKNGIRLMGRACADIAIEHFGGYEVQKPDKPIELKKKLPPEITKAIPLKTEKVEEIKTIAPETVKADVIETLPPADETEKTPEPVKKVRKTPVRSKSKKS
jgi:hypothetical protein